MTEKSTLIDIIHNPNAGRRRVEYLSEFTTALTSQAQTWRVQSTTYAGHATAIARKTDAQIVVAAGGDGTINEVLNGLMQRPEPRPILALLPMGTANAVAHEAGIAELSPVEHAHLLTIVEPTPINIGQANDRYFLQMAGIGFDAHIVRNVNPGLKRAVGKLAYIWGALVELLIYKPQVYRLTIDGQTRHAAAAIIANGRYYAGRFVCAPQARLTDPVLQICLLPRPGRLNIMRYAIALLTNRFSAQPDLRIIPVTQVRIETLGLSAAAEPVQCDGEPTSELPAEFRIHPRAVRLVMRPAP